MGCRARSASGCVANDGGAAPLAPYRPRVPPVFVFADVHDHYDRLFDLLVAAGLVDPVTHARLRGDVRVVSLGDLGHFGERGSAGSRLCYQAVRAGWVDLVLWGNHDRAVIDGAHEFSGYQRPDGDVVMLVRALHAQGRMPLAHAAHGHLLTHAGLHRRFAHQAEMERVDKADPEQVAAYINDLAAREMPGENAALWDAIGETRGGPEGAAGGILWRHWAEPLHDAFPQICGHTSANDVRARRLGVDEDTPNALDALAGDEPLHACLDVGTPRNGRLAGMWLPSRELVEVRRPDWGVTALG